MRLTLLTRPILSATVMTLALSGCTIAKFNAMERDGEQIVSDHDKLLEEFAQKKAQDLPFSESLEIQRQDAFLYREIDHDYSSLPFRKVLKGLFPGTPIVYDKSIPPAYNPPVIAPPNAYLVKDHLDAIALQTNLGWSIKSGVVFISPNQVVHYDVPMFGSMEGRGGQGVRQTFSVGNNNLSASGSAGGGGGGFRNETAGTISAYEELASLVSSTTSAQPCDAQTSEVRPAITSAHDPIIAPSPCFTLSGAGNMLILNARPQAHSQFLRAYEPWIKSTNTQVQITLKVFMMDVSELAQQSLDISILRSAAISSGAAVSTLDGLGLAGGSFSQNFVSFDESANGLTFSYDEGSRYRGSEMMLKALNQVAKTYMYDINEFIIGNNQVHSEFSYEETPYLKKVSVTTQNTSSTSSTRRTAPTVPSSTT